MGLGDDATREAEEAEAEPAAASPLADPLMRRNSAVRRVPLDPLIASGGAGHVWRVRLPSGAEVRARLPAALTPEEARWALKPLFRGASFHGARVPDDALPLLSSTSLTCAVICGGGNGIPNACVSFVRLEDDDAMHHAFSAAQFARLGHRAAEARHRPGCRNLNRK